MRLEQPLFARADQQFNFSRSVTVVFDTHRRVEYPAEFVAIVPTLSVGSIFYHFVDARRRDPAGLDDFRAWMMGLGSEYDEINKDLAEVDPYFESLYVLRDRLHQIFASPPRVSGAACGQKGRAQGDRSRSRLSGRGTA